MVAMVLLLELVQVVGGSRNCNTCGGAGKYWEEVGQYTGNSYKKKVDCPVCYGTGRCGTCHGKGSL